MKIVHDSEVAAHGQQVISATAFIHQKVDGVEKVYLAKRAGTKKFLPGVFEVPGGHIDFGEDIVKGLAREVFEEFGKTVAVGDPFYAFTYMNKVKGSHSVEVMFFARFTDPSEEIRLDPADHSRYGWFAEDELDRVAAIGREADDPEMIAARKGFAILRGESLKTH